ncbi:hypothetical protein ACI79D_24870 [Geodermatophilus sp. SYSU D00708]
MSRAATPRQSGRSLLLRRGLPVLVLVLLAGLLLVLTVGRDDAPGSPAAAPSASAPASTTDEPGTDPEATPTPTEPVAPVTEAAAPSLVARAGVDEAARTVEAAPAAFTAPAEWSDGASVRVVEARQQVTGGRGPGDLAGQPQTLLTLELTNGTDAALDLNAVVVQAAYGDGASQAAPLYDRETVDFGGTLEPGDTATAVYSFAIPDDQLDRVSLSVDVDGTRFPAVFSGAVPTR